MSYSKHQGRVLFIVGGDFSCHIEEKHAVGLVDRHFQPASNQVETVEKAFA